MFRLAVQSERREYDKQTASVGTVAFGEHRVVYLQGEPVIYEGPAGDAHSSTKWDSSEVTKWIDIERKLLTKPDNLAVSDMFARINQALVLYTQSMVRQKITQE